MRESRAEWARKLREDAEHEREQVLRDLNRKKLQSREDFLRECGDNDN